MEHSSILPLSMTILGYPVAFIVTPAEGSPFTIFISDEDITGLFCEHHGEEVFDEEIASRIEEHIRNSFKKWASEKSHREQAFYLL